MDFHLAFGFQQGTDTNEFYATTSIAACNKIYSILNGVAAGASMVDRCCFAWDWTNNQICNLKETNQQASKALCTGSWVPADLMSATIRDKPQVSGCFLQRQDRNKPTEHYTLRVSTLEEHRYDCGQNNNKKCFCLQPCNTGKYGSYDHKDCQSCVAGRYSDKTGLVKSTDALPCAICPKGYWQDEAGSTSCKVW